jgi:signal transduction histidine kinase/CheY-like chemotaxis protein
MNLVTLVSMALFGFLFVATLIAYLRRRDTLDRDVMLIFGSVAAVFVVTSISAAGVRVPDPVVGASLAFLIAQPLFALRLAHQLRPVPAPVRLTAVVGVVAMAATLLVIPLAQIRPAFLFGAAVFVGTHLAAAFFLALEARRRVGSARVRLGAAAAGGVSMALALALALLGSQFDVVSELGRIVALLAATLYLLAFLPPGWVRNVWSAVATHRFLQALIGTDAGDSVEVVWVRAADLARRSSGAVAALVVAGNPPRILASAVEPGAELPTVSIDLVPASDDEQRRLVPADNGLAVVGESLEARYISVLPFEGIDAEPGAVVLLRARPSLFAADDHRILGALVAGAALFAQRSGAMQRQEALSDRLGVTVEALGRASQAKSDFLASMSHELRTPLSAIIGFSALMRDEPLDGDRRQVPDEWVEHIHRSGEHLLSLINDVLDLTKIEAGRIELERETFDLGAALAESVEGLRPLADRKRLQVAIDAEPGQIHADRGRLRQVVYNLLSNAIKFTPDEGRIRVESRWADDEARIAVVDSGVGIAPEDLGRIFDEFSQVGDLKAREAGTGLGLALSRRLAEAHGGELTVSSELGVGSRFELRIPDSRAPQPESLATSVGRRVPTDAGATVLVIEDDPGAVRLLRTYLEAEGYEVDAAASGEAGLAAARASTPAAILLDVLLPGMDGWEVLRQLKVDPDLRDVPVLVATVVDERNVAMRLGAADYFLKPVRPDALLARLSQYTFTTKVKQRSVRVVAIDDDPAARDLVVQALRPAGFDVVAAASGREGLALALERPPDLVICDLVMPDMDGYEVVDRLQADETTRDTVILILTGQELSSTDRERLNGKVAQIIAKGDDPRPALSSWLRRAAATAERRHGRIATAAG